MTGKWRLLFFAVVMLWISARTMMRAFAVPWTWNHDQALLAWLAVCVALILSIWVTAWLRGGNEALQVRWKRMLEQAAAPMDGKRFWRNLWFWIGVAVVLVFIFNMTQH